jgi:hypothetical protein
MAVYHETESKKGRASHSGFRFPISGFRFPVSGFRFPVSGFRFPVSGFFRFPTQPHSDWSPALISMPGASPVTTRDVGLLLVLAR